MSLTKELLHRMADPALTHSERVHLRCQLAKHLEETGDYEGARKAMGELWSRVGERPALDGLDQATAAEVLLRAGALTGWIGSSKQIDGSQEMSKNLISEGIHLFEALQDTEKVAEAQTDLAYCYWRQGALDEARVMLRHVLSQLADSESEVKAVALIRSAIVERSAKRFHEALHIHTEAAPLFEKVGSHSLKGRFHVNFANVLMHLGETEGNKDYLDHAIIEYTAASYHFEQAGHTRYHACVENNLGYLFLVIGKYSEAHEHLDHAQAFFTNLKDSVHLAQVDETRARVFLAEGRVTDAEKLAASAVRTLDRGGEQSLLAEALTTHGITLARLVRHEHARLTLQRAVEVAEQAGDLEHAGRAALTIIEELGEHLTRDDLLSTNERAGEFLSSSRNLTTARRLSTGACRTLFLIHSRPAPPDWNGFSLKETVRRYEANLIEKALRDAGGQVTRAAQLLGLGYQSLVATLNSRHRHLLPERKPVVPRKRSVIAAHDDPHPPRGAEGGAARALKILHVEDNKFVASAVKDTLNMEGWEVETCTDGAAALKKLESAEHYDLLLLDNKLPIVSGVELTRAARELPHRQRTPVVMLSAAYCEREAWDAGVDAFLRKPRDVAAITDTIKSFLTNESE